MIGTLRRRFLLIALASLTGTLAALCLVINLGYRHITKGETPHWGASPFPVPKPGMTGSGGAYLWREGVMGCWHGWATGFGIPGCWACFC